MAGMFEGLNGLERTLFANLCPPAPVKRERPIGKAFPSFQAERTFA
jgi:hypothetical protein